MPRPVSRHKVLVSLSQWEYLSRLAARRAELAKKVDPKNRAIISTVKGFAEKVAAPPEEQVGDLFVLKTTRQELRFLEKALTNEHAALLTAVIPGYMTREQEFPDQADRYKAYREVATAKAQEINTILNLVKKALA